MTPEHRENVITVYRPGTDFPSLSVTGECCDQMCEHCRGINLRGMTPIHGSDDLKKLAQEIHDEGGTGFLLSGGCDINGTVPVYGYAKALACIPKGLHVNVHPGFITRDEARELADAGVTCFSVDIHQDRGEISSVLHLERGPEDYSKLLDDLIASGAKVMPHLTVGFGSDDFWMSAKLVLSKGLKDVILLTMMPTAGTCIEESVLTEDAILHAVRMLREMGLNVILGCMRDRSLRGLEIGCIKEGVTAIANPSLETLSWARENGYTVRLKKICCCYDWLYEKE